VSESMGAGAGATLRRWAAQNPGVTFQPNRVASLLTRTRKPGAAHRERAENQLGLSNLDVPLVL